MQLDPVGSAPLVRGFLLVWWPLPWPADVSEVPELQAVVGQAKAQGVRVQLVTADGAEPMVVLYRLDRPGAPFTRFASAVRRAADRHGVVEAALQLLGAAEAAVVPGTGLQPAGASHAFEASQAPVADVLVCTHGRRDRCCGAAGQPLYEAMAAAAGGSMRIWRTSHTGGHRFAPTVVVLPEATAWAFADMALLNQVVDRRGAFNDVAERYRGCSGLSSPAGQVLERIALEEVGWSVLGASRQVEALGADRHRLTVRWPDGQVGMWEATVAVGRRLALPACGTPAGDPVPAGGVLPADGVLPGTKTEAEYVARQVVRLDDPPPMSVSPG